ncbi:hypothetical protein MBLNU459_g5031t3 [Dothideomycetes sp. NU459]
MSAHILDRQDVVIACHNSPTSVTLSGDEGAIDQIRDILTQEGIFVRKLKTSGKAYHSHLIKESGQFYHDIVANSLPEMGSAMLRTPKTPMYSTVTGKSLGEIDAGISYWRSNLENPVLFHEAMQALIREQRPDVTIEIGPHSALSGPIRQIAGMKDDSRHDSIYLPTLIRGSNGADDMLNLAGSLYLVDTPIDLSRVRSAQGGQAYPEGLRSARGMFRAVDSNQRLILDADIAFSSLESSFGVPAIEMPNQPYTRLVWKPDLDWLASSDIQSVFPTGSRNPIWREVLDRMDEISALCILDSIERFPTIVDAADQPPHLQKFCRWLQSKESEVRQRPDTLVCPSQRRQRINAISELLAADAPEAVMIAKLNDRIVDILDSTVGSLDVMVEDGLLSRVYEHGFGHKAAYPQLIKAVDLLAHKEPRLRILEIGAGTGGATVPMMEALDGKSFQPRYLTYTFTDVSSAFLGAAKEKFAACRNIDYQVLNAELDVLQQGFEEATYDLILASNVIHATEDITSTLRNCGTLLRPGGKLIVVETTQDRLVSGYMLGTLPGYWLGEKDGRSQSPFIPSAAWDERLRAAGFSGADICLDDYDAPWTSTNVIVSTCLNVDNIPEAIDNEGGDWDTTSVDTPEKIWLVHHNTPHEFVTKLEGAARSQRIPTERVHLLELHERISKGARVLMLAELEAPLLSHMSSDEMAALKYLVLNASCAIWLTSCGLLTGDRPECSLIFGLAKSIITEQPSFRISTVDIDEKDLARSARFIMDHELRLRKDVTMKLDTELIEKDGLVYVSRLIADYAANDHLTDQTSIQPKESRLHEGLSLDFLNVGQTDSFYFSKSPVDCTSPPLSHVSVRNHAFSLTKTASLELKLVLHVRHLLTH